MNESSENTSPASETGGKVQAAPTDPETPELEDIDNEPLLAESEPLLKDIPVQETFSEDVIPQTPVINLENFDLSVLRQRIFELESRISDLESILNPLLKKKKKKGLQLIEVKSKGHGKKVISLKSKGKSKKAESEKEKGKTK